MRFPGGGLQLLYRSPFLGRQGRAGCHGVENVPVVDDRPPALLILPERFGQDGGSFEHQALGRGDRTVDDRPVQHLARCPELDPAQTVQPAPLVERRQEAFGISAVTRYDVTVQPTGAAQAFAGIGVEQPGTGRSAEEARSVMQVGHRLRQHCPKIVLEAIGYVRGHSTAVKVQQHERLTFLAVENLVVGAGDGVCLSIELFLGDDPDLVGQPVAQGAERDGLRGVQASYQLRQFVHARNFHALGRALDHHARRAVAHERAIRRQ
jgi:hypothetical protein